MKKHLIKNKENGVILDIKTKEKKCSYKITESPNNDGKYKLG